MTRLHFADLTAITAPFGLLDDDTQARLHAWRHGWEWLGPDGKWQPTDALGLSHAATYRARPAPLVQDTVDWSHVAEPYNWHARDESGQGFFFEEEPTKYDFYWTADGKYRSSAAHASYRPGTVDWRDSKISRPGVKG
jgi:hypothetical protein